MTSFFSENDKTRISAAIRDAESKTSGEIVAVVATQSDSYIYAPFLAGAIAALLTPWILMTFTWSSAIEIYLTQLCVFVLISAVFSPPKMRMQLVPRSVRRRHTSRRAAEQFLSHNLHATAGRTGVLIFVSIAERHAEIVADSAINQKVPHGTWQNTVDRLVRDIGSGRAADGFVAAISEVGRHLAEQFPPGKLNPNEIPDHLIILD